MKNFLVGLAIAFCDLILQDTAILADDWPHVALANGRLCCKDRDGHMACFESVDPAVGVAEEKDAP